jgi:hypothetical protein
MPIQKLNATENRVIDDEGNFIEPNTELPAYVDTDGVPRRVPQKRDNTVVYVTPNVIEAMARRGELDDRPDLKVNAKV